MVFDDIFYTYHNVLRSLCGINNITHIRDIAAVTSLCIFKPV